MDAPEQTPYGRHIFICNGEYSTLCDPDGQAQRLSGRLSQWLRELGSYENPQRVKVSLASCLGVCMGGPLLVVYPDGIWYHHVDEALLRRIVEEHLRNNLPVEEAIFHRLSQA